MFLGYGGGDAPISATGGTTNDYTQSSIPYRSHTFTASGSFVISTLGSGVDFETIDVMVVGGGGGGGLPPLCRYAGRCLGTAS